MNFLANSIYIYIYIYTHTHTHTHIFTIAFAIMLYHRILNIVLCAIQQDLVYPFYIQKLTSAKPNLPLHPSLNSLPCGKHQSVLYVCESVSGL